MVGLAKCHGDGKDRLSIAELMIGLDVLMLRFDVLALLKKSNGGCMRTSSGRRQVLDQLFGLDKNVRIGPSSCKQEIGHAVNVIVSW